MAGYELPALTNIAQSLCQGPELTMPRLHQPLSLHMFLRQPKLQSITKYSGGGGGANNLNSYLLAHIASGHFPSAFLNISSPVIIP